MKISKQNSYVFVGTLVIVSFILGISKTAQAANFFFEPAGSQKDKDTIFDIEVKPSEKLIFSVKADLNGLALPANTVSLLFQYNIQNDLAELTRKFDFSQLPKTINVADGLIQTINELEFEVNQPGDEPHDGISDFGITLIRATALDGNLAPLGIFLPGGANSFPAASKNIRGEAGTDFHQVVEVQVPIPESTSTLSLLTLGTLGAASTLKYKLKCPTSQRKS